MKITLPELFGKLESLTAKLNIEIDLPDNPAPGSIQEAAKKAGLSGVFGFLRKLIDTPQANPGIDSLDGLVTALSGLLNQKAPPIVADTVDKGSELLKAAGAKGIDSFAKAIASLIPKEAGSSDGKGTGKDPETPPVDTDMATVAADLSSPTEERPALPSSEADAEPESKRGRFTNSTAIV